MLVVGICGPADRDGYNWLSKAGYKHEKVNHGKNQKINAEGLGANPVEALISRVFLVGCSGKLSGKLRLPMYEELRRHTSNIHII